jgi:transcriptional regulator with XRE-family HTH domain
MLIPNRVPDSAQYRAEDFGAFLQMLRKQTGKARRQIARLAQISATYLAQVESGDRNPPDQDFLRRLARCYRRAPVELFRRAGYLTDADEFNPEEDEVIRAYNFAISDPRIPAQHIPSAPMPLEVMKLVVVAYEGLTGKRLLGGGPQMASPYEVASLLQGMFTALAGKWVTIQFLPPPDDFR